MAHLILTRNLAENASSARLSGAQLRVYNTGTTTLTSLYTSVTLATPLSNPVVADSSGIFPQIFLAESTVVDTAMFTSVASGSVPVPGRDEVGVIALGSDTGALLRDLTGSRFKVRNVGGVVYIETGNATGDDVGGSGLIGGWAGTQADDITINAALVNILGRLKENGKKIIGSVYTEATTFTAASTVNIPLTNDPTGCRAWEVDIFDFIQSGNANIRLRLSYDNGATYKSGATDYTTRVISATNGTTAGVTAAQADLTISSTTPANTPGRFILRIIGPNTGSDSTNIMSHAMVFDNAGTPLPDMHTATIWGRGGYGRPTHVQILQSGAVTLTGKYLVRCLRGYGET